HYSYNENGQLFQIRQPNVFTQFAYFADGMIASKTYTHVQTRHSQTEEFEYNLNNQLSKAKNKESQNDFYRNALGQLVREHQHYNVPNLKPMTAVLRYEYDELGNLNKTIRPDGQVQSNLSYGSGHIFGIAFNKQDMVAFQRDDLHRETVRMLANGLIQSKNYNDVGLLSSQIIQPEQETVGRVQHQAERHYQYDQNYLLTQVNDSRLGKLTYQYDAIGRLTLSQSLHQTENFAFDPAGNLIDPVATQTSQVKSNLISQYKGKNYKYDAQGNVIEISHAGKTLKLTWDNLNRLIRSDHQGQVTEYGYDVFGRRLFKKNQNAQTLTLFGWDGDLMIWESQQSNKAEENYTKHYVYEPQSFVPLLQTGYTGFIKLLETPDYAQFQHEDYSVYKDPIWKHETRKNKAELEKVAFYHCDQVGTPQTLTNELGECVWEIKQDTWGTALEINTGDNLLEQSNLRFQGQYYDSETGLHYNRYRYYEPFSARYVSKDPIGLFGGLNNSAYVSDPNLWIDPMGLQDKNNNGFTQKTLELMAASDKRAIDLIKRESSFMSVEKREANAEAYRQQQLAAKVKEDEQKRKEKRREYSGQMGINQMNVPGKSQVPQKSLTQIAKENVKTTGTIGEFSTKAIGGFSGAVGLADSQTADGKNKKCGIAYICPSFGAAVEVTGSIQKLVSTSELSSGISASTCVNGAAGALVGAKGSVCTTNFDSSGIDLKNRTTGIKSPKDYASVDNYTGTAGPAIGVALGADVSFCPQITICSAPK
uniref:RHS repeat-associated core domain-containing protein n=1 Tax=Acinetobacter sp. CFCC 11171 TaxID=1775558 RepID=UPI001D1725C2